MKVHILFYNHSSLQSLTAHHWRTTDTGRTHDGDRVNFQKHNCFKN